MQQSRDEEDRLSVVIWIFTIGMLTFFSNLHRQTLSVLGTDIAAEFSLDSIQLGTLGSAIFYAYGLMQVPAGILADRVSSRKLLTVSSLLIAVSTLWFGLTGSYAGLIGARVLTGASAALAFVPALTAVRRRFGDKHYGMYTGILSTITNAGGVFASAPTHFLANLFGWRNTILLFGGLSLLLTAALWFVVTEPKEKQELSPFSLTGMVKDIRSLMTVGIVCVAIGFFCVGGSRQAFSGLWGGNYFTDALSLGADTSSLYLMAVSIGCCFGTMVFGFLTDRFGNFPILIGGSAFVAVIWFLFAFFQNAPGIVLLLLCLLLGLTGAGTYITGYSCIREFMDPSRTGVFTGLMNGCGFIGTAVFTQLGGGILELSSGTPVQQFGLLFTVFGVLSAVCAVIILLSNRGKWKA